jgi:hypothetical protein
MKQNTTSLMPDIADIEAVTTSDERETEPSS